LRERKEDIPLLINSFLDKYSREEGKKFKGIEKPVLNLLLNYDWPGNIRELENVIQSLVTLETGDTITTTYIPPEILGLSKSLTGEMRILKGTFREAKEKFEKEYVIETLRAAKGNISKAAELSQIHRPNFYEKLKKYDIKSEDYT